MISPAKMKKIEILLLKEDKDEIVDDLYDLECVELVECEVCAKFPVPPTTRESISRSIQIDRILNFLGHYAPEEKGSLLDSLRGKRVDKKEVGIISAEELILQADDIINKVDPKIKDFESQMGEIDEELETLHDHITFLSIIRDLDIDLALLRSTPKTLRVVGKLHEQDREAIVHDVREATEGYCMVDFWKNLIFISTFKEKERSVDLLFSNHGIKRVDVPLIDGKPDEVLPELENKVSFLKGTYDEHAQTIRELNTKWEHQLRTVKELLDIESEKSNAFRKLASTENVIALEGLYPAKNEKKLLERLMENERIVVHLKEPDGEPSIKLDNRGFFKPFETLTELYGLPKYNEIDPTIFFALFFTLFFGIMMTDFVYGIMITVVGLFLSKTVKEGAVHDVASVLFYCGMATAACGIAFGSYFGDLFTGGYVALDIPMLVDPLYGAMDILIFSLAVGLAHLVLSNIVGFVQRAKNGKMHDAFVENFTWLLMMGGIIIASIGILTGMSMSVIQIAAGVPIAFSIAIIIVNGVRNGLAGIITAFMDIPGFMGNWLSYARLLALALSTAGIAMVMNLFASMMWGLNILGIQIGIIFAVVMFIGGHIFNLAVNGLGAFVHSLRLHYVEFFTYFYNAEGKKFEPLRIERTYTKYIKRGE
jgi:V/A-type H+-transporting ATPase subunit I